MARYGMQTTVKGSLEEVRAKVTDALKRQASASLPRATSRRRSRRRLAPSSNPT